MSTGVCVCVCVLAVSLLRHVSRSAAGSHELIRQSLATATRTRMQQFSFWHAARHTCTQQQQQQPATPQHLEPTCTYNADSNTRTHDETYTAAVNGPSTRMCMPHTHDDTLTHTRMSHDFSVSLSFVAPTGRTSRFRRGLWEQSNTQHVTATSTRAKTQLKYDSNTRATHATHGGSSLR